MFFRQVLYRDLGCASYVLGDAGEAVVVDPRWDIDVYLEIARTERARITQIVVGSLQIPRARRGRAPPRAPDPPGHRLVAQRRAVDAAQR